MRDLAKRASAGSPAEQQKAAEILAQHLTNNPTLLIRIEAARLLGELQGEVAEGALQLAARDPESDVRMAAVAALKKRKDALALQTLQQMIGSDTDLDVRLAATRALGEFSGSSAAQALSLALADPDPALQARAVDALRASTGKKFDGNVRAWKDYLASFGGRDTSSRTLVRRYGAGFV